MAMTRVRRYDHRMTIVNPERPLVSVVMPVHNSARTLRNSVLSVLAQTYRWLELIVVDDASTDSSADIAHALRADDDRVRVVSRPARGGPATARNDGIAAARGRFIALCDADDMWLSTKLARQIEVALRTRAPLVFSEYHRIDADHTATAAEFVARGRVVHVPTVVTRTRLLRSNVIGALTALFDRERSGLVAVPGIDGAEDWALWLRVLRGGEVAIGIDEPLALYRAAQRGSHSAHRWRAVRAVWRVLRRQERLSVWSAAWHTATNATAAVRKLLI
jgi:glycosyltransferase involved in cell wall biosynthesis